MEKKLWHIIISYFKDVYIESTGSAFNEELHVIMSEGRYQLCTTNAVYSFEDKYINYRKSFDWIDWSKHEIKRVLLLGLGLGSVPQMLEQLFFQKFEYHAVEIDEVVIDLANKYILKELHSPMQIFNTDARHFVKLSTEKYDMIIMDIFDDDKVPEVFETGEFLDDLKRILTPKGIILFNRLNLTEKDHDDTTQYFEKTFKLKFDDASCHEIAGNYMLTNRKAVFELRNS